MKLFNELQLTYIPELYWNESFSGFKVDSSEKVPPKHASFFLLWLPLNTSEKDLIEQINVVFPNIPAKNLLTCQMKLAVPLEWVNANANEKATKTFFGIDYVLGKVMPVPPAIKFLYQLQFFEENSRYIKPISNSIRTWAFLSKFVFELLNRGNFVPILEPHENNTYTGQWRLLLKTQSDYERFKAIINNSPWSAFNLPINFLSASTGKSNPPYYETDGLWDPSYIFLNFMDKVGDYLIRSILNKAESQLFKSFYGGTIEKEKDEDFIPEWDFKFLNAVMNSKSNIFNVQKFSETIIPTILNNWVQNAQGFSIKGGLSFVLDLKYPNDSSKDWPLEFYIQPLQENVPPIPFKEIWEGFSAQKKEILKFFKTEANLFEVILRALGTASKIFPPIKRALDTSIPQEVKLNPEEVMELLKYPKDVLIQSGFIVNLPEVFNQGGKQRLSSRLIIRSDGKKKAKKGTSTALPSMFDVNSILNYTWDATLEGAKLTEEEFKELLKADTPLINWRGKWVLIDQLDLEELRAVFEKGKELGMGLEPEGKIKYIDAIKLGLTGTIQLRDNGTKYDVVVEGDFKTIVNRLQSIESFNKVLVPKSFNGSLRPYQEIGLTWLNTMSEFNFGMCLADDMGLGKTIQVIALLLYRKEKYPKEQGSILIVCPTSVLFNWTRELKKFAPDLEIFLHHGPDRVKDAIRLPELTKSHRIILTSYGTLRNDIDFLQSIPFSGVIVDESQNMKNYASRQTQAIYKLQCQYRICLSGTPIENRLLELWTLFEFLNPGLLGNRTDFQKKFVVPIERFRDQDAINKLKKIISPFILRRVKKDKAIISDLPEKNEMKLFMDLSEVQAKLYRELVEKILKELETIASDQIKRKGLILKLLVHLKQICNHPHQYLKMEISKIESEKDMEEFLLLSPKMERLIEITDEIISNGEKILIFTQFKKMGDIIEKVFAQKYNFKVLFFHGGVPEKKRKEIVDEFQSNEKDSSPILILSLKAGGTGLNLTQGTTVIHFDRWWNPAVEDQATDRAYRIGQKSQVNVYKFITVGTIEEKIDLLLEEKRDLADKIVSASPESWISQLSNDKLKELVSLNK